MCFNTETTESTEKQPAENAEFVLMQNRKGRKENSRKEHRDFL